MLMVHWCTWPLMEAWIYYVVARVGLGFAGPQICSVCLRRTAFSLWCSYPAFGRSFDILGSAMHLLYIHLRRSHASLMTCLASGSRSQTAIPMLHARLCWLLLTLLNGSLAANFETCAFSTFSLRQPSHLSWQSWHSYLRRVMLK